MMLDFRKFIHKWIWVLLIAFCTVGLIYPWIGVAALICMLAPVMTAFFKGRFWCGNYCPRGSFSDIILPKVSRSSKIPQLLKRKWFRISFLVVLMGAFAVQLFFAWGDIYAVGGVFVRMVIITTLLTIVLGIFYNQRSWCTICPMGTMAHYASKLKVSKSRMENVNFNKATCIGCKICMKNCPSGINILKHREKGNVSDPDCLKCNKCVEKCPKKSLYIT